MDSTTPQSHRRRADERGQAMVEFALIAPLFLMIVVGVIQFGVALNFWLDMQRLANQGARSAAVNCGTSGNQCEPTTPPPAGYSKLEWKLSEDIISRGNTPDEIEVCYVEPFSGATPGVGDAVMVRLTERYRLAAIVNLAKIDLTATATMRLEQIPNSGGGDKLPDPADSDNYC
jgi:Flp pilus assembly pilin Flp